MYGKCDHIRRKIVEDLRCKRCGKDEESVEHAVLWCCNSVKLKRYWVGNVVVALYKALPGRFDVDLGEFLAHREGFVVKWVESDATNIIIAAVQSKESSNGPVGVILDDVKALCREVGVLNVIMFLD
ncbi:hypothetical protein Q3G72_013412 [Acer saccharum]|nr:hypothetical protein Q3G72_013412 [Acer saccharum]